MTFKNWLFRLKGKDTPIGDLANDVFHDASFPEDDSYAEILNHLKRHNACKEAIKTFNTAWKYYQRYISRHPDI